MLSAWTDPPDGPTPSPKFGSMETPLFVAVIAQWQLGDRWDVEVVRGEREFEEGTLIAADSATTLYRKVVTRMDGDSYLVRWYTEAFENSTGDDYSDIASTLDEQALLRMSADGYQLRMNEFGQLVELENHALYLETADSMIDGIIESRAEDAEEAATMRTLFEGLGGGAWLLTKMLEPVEVFYGLNGYEWPLKERRSYADLLDTGNLANTVDLLGSVYLDKVDVVEGTFVLTETVKADDLQLKDAMIELVVASGTEREKAEAELREARVWMRDENRYVVDFFNGILLSADQLRITMAGDIRNESFTRIRTRIP